MGFVTVARAEGPKPLGAGDLPIAVASFPADPFAPVPSAAAPGVASPAVVAPGGASATAHVAPSPADAPPATDPAGEHMDVEPALDDAGGTQAVTPLELGVLSLVRLFEQGVGLVAAAQGLGPSSDERAFDLAAQKELRRLTFMRRLSAMHEAQNEREFSERLSVYLRKREFLQALESRGR